MSCQAVGICQPGNGQTGPGSQALIVLGRLFAGLTNFGQFLLDG